jgi:hypothetical protein
VASGIGVIAGQWMLWGWGRLVGFRSLLICYRVVKGKASGDTLEVVHAITGGANQLPDSDKMHTSFFLRVWILHQGYFAIGFQAVHLGQLDVVVDALSVEFKVEASILESAGELDDRLANILNLLLARYLTEAPGQTNLFFVHIK